ncbi:hypothetical protein HG536_0F03130 [Torulaspora globosa]|uniref:Prefoldin subunit 2 n=1 Tax=Torulaspora globosa TaxID=48254 RepID=A0A7G3ZKF2_9SACH|nr:uncharacterized protein HG536_0F03130 [Torulaspora globosa]QLL33988.1 hypothetical protein HG536_0F03130 [Torulaspora globosa]
MEQGSNVFQLKYNEYKQTLEELQSKVIELSHDKDEHDIVLETLSKTDPERICYRMVGGALVQSDVKTTLPILTTKRDKITETVSRFKAELISVAQEFEKWKKDNKIHVVKQ